MPDQSTVDPWRQQPAANAPTLRQEAEQAIAQILHDYSLASGRRVMAVDASALMIANVNNSQVITYTVTIRALGED